MKTRGLKSNVGSCDAAVRFVAGVGLLALANHGWRWGWVGMAPVATAATGFCPLWWLLRRDTAAGEHGDGVRLVPHERSGQEGWRRID